MNASVNQPELSRIIIVSTYLLDLILMDADCVNPGFYSLIPRHGIQYSQDDILHHVTWPR